MFNWFRVHNSIPYEHTDHEIGIRRGHMKILHEVYESFIFNTSNAIGLQHRGKNRNAAPCRGTLKIACLR